MSDDIQANILVVDDDPALQQLITTLLNRAGITPISAMNVTEARAVLEVELPDLILLDLMLPEMSGIEYLQELRQQDRFERLPVIILSALADPDQIREGLDAGADRYLTKPYLANNLLRTVKDVLKTGRITE